MIGTLARKRTNWAALAVLAGLMVALFAVMASAQTGPRITSTTDSDFIIADGGQITVSVTDGVSGATYTFQPVFGFVLSGTVAGGPATYTHQAGGPSGTFKIRATTTSTGATTLERDLTVGEAGTNLAVVNTKLGTLNAADNTRYDPTADPAETPKAEEATADVGTNILIDVEALNSLGAKSNAPTAGDLSVTIFTVGGVVASGDDAVGATTTSVTVASTAVQQNVIPFAVTRTTPGTVRVFAVATIGTETEQSADLNLTFTAVAGPPVNPVVEDGGTVGQGGTTIRTLDDGSAATADSDGNFPAATRATLSVSATDTDGLTAVLAQATIAADGVTVKGPDDKDVTENSVNGVAVARYVLDNDDAAAGNQSVIIVTLADDAAPGEYTVTAAIGTATDSATFTVTGSPTNVEVVVDAPDGTGLGEQLTATATVTDANGNLVAPTTVEFTVGAGSPATFVGINPKTKDGVGSRSAVITGSGVITVVATAGGVSGVDVIVAGDGADAGAADEASLDCFSSKLSGFSSWTCDVDSTASEAFTLLEGRGATALHLWNGSMWLRYAVVDSGEVPGSENFPISDGDILYISN